ncbi:hypothetical protein HK099_003662 [Clydaea vesicula]|uniref:Nuclear polyadenylated RNA-binding protein NAB2 n=1 Tax=Clydaea vesicula TaxID=447962 RepID=A0AAD5U344_9FUNG|nr:hypothetical protein HK099_003662 [Clydaea vesicula]
MDSLDLDHLQKSLYDKSNSLGFSLNDELLNYFSVLISHNKTKEELKEELQQVVAEDFPLDEILSWLFQEYLNNSVSNKKRKATPDEPNADVEDANNNIPKPEEKKKKFTPIVFDDNKTVFNSASKSSTVSTKFGNNDTKDNKESLTPPKSNELEEIKKKGLNNIRQLQQQQQQQQQQGFRKGGNVQLYGAQMNQQNQRRHMQKQNSNNFMGGNMMGIPGGNFNQFPMNFQQQQQQMAQQMQYMQRQIQLQDQALKNQQLQLQKEQKALAEKAAAVAQPALCKFGVHCTRSDCKYGHPSPAAMAAAAKSSKSHIQCRFYPNCLNPACPFLHPPGNNSGSNPANSPNNTANLAQVPCRFEPFCSKNGCPYMHEKKDVHKSERSFAVSESEVEEVLANEENTNATEKTESNGKSDLVKGVENNVEEGRRSATETEGPFLITFVKQKKILFIFYLS